jgi:hypothetical protein
VVVIGNDVIRLNSLLAAIGNEDLPARCCRGTGNSKATSRQSTPGRHHKGPGVGPTLTTYRQGNSEIVRTVCAFR